MLNKNTIWNVSGSDRNRIRNGLEPLNQRTAELTLPSLNVTSAASSWLPSSAADSFDMNCFWWSSSGRASGGCRTKHRSGCCFHFRHRRHSGSGSCSILRGPDESSGTCSGLLGLVFWQFFGWRSLAGRWRQCFASRSPSWLRPSFHQTWNSEKDYS